VVLAIGIKALAIQMYIVGMHHVFDLGWKEEAILEVGSCGKTLIGKLVVGVVGCVGIGQFGGMD
jgi:hypothetical protein